MPRVDSVAAPLTGAQHRLLKHLAAWRAATVAQLSDRVSANERNVRRTLGDLVERGAVKMHNLDAPSPTIAEITLSGARLVGVEYPTRRSSRSWAVITHQCHLNELELRLQPQYPGSVIPPVELYALGLNPSVGEHGYRLDSGPLWLILLDDYGTPSNRAARSWTRPHTPQSGYCDDPATTSWSARAAGMIVATTSRARAELHRWRMPPLHIAPSSITATPGAEVKPVYVTIPALWGAG